MDRRPGLGQVAVQPIQLGAQLGERPAGHRIAEVHVGDRGEVDLGALQLTEGCPQNLPVLVRGALVGHSKDRVAHESKLGTPVLELRVGVLHSRMDLV